MKHRLPIFIEGSVFAAKKQSGIAYATAQYIVALASIPELNRRITILLPRGESHIPRMLKGYPIAYKYLPLSARFMRLLSRLPVTPQLDRWYGRGLYIFPNYFNFNVSRRSKSMTFIYDIAFRLFPESLHPRNRAFLDSHIKRWIKRTDHILTLTETSKAEIVQYLEVDKNRVTPVYIPLRKDIFQPQSAAVASLRERYGIPKKYILYLGNLEPRKNVATLIEAFAHSRAKHEGVTLVLVGADAWNNEAIERAILAAQNNGARVVMPNHHVTDEDLPALLTGALFLVQPSLYEGFGVPPIQALACKRPVIVSDIPVMHEILNGYARYFNPHDAASLTRQIDALLTKKVKLDSRAIDAHLAQFSPENSAQLILQAEAKL